MALPAYMNELWQAYWQMSQEDRRAIDPALASVDPLTCHVAVLPYLAWECGVAIDGVEEQEARGLIAAAIEVAKCAGSVGALKGALEHLYGTEVQEWFEYGASPYRFRLLARVESGVFGQREFGRLKEAIDRHKNVRSQCDGVVVKSDYGANIGIGGGLAVKARLQKEANIVLGACQPIGIGSGMCFEIRMSDEMELSMELNDERDIQGAVIWRV